MRWLNWLIVPLLLICTAPCAAQEVPTQPRPAAASAIQPEFEALSALRLNQIQVIGTHNSYKQLIQPELFQQMVASRPSAESLDYAHLPIPLQLDIGLRNLEIDLYNDPEGGHYADPLGNRLLRDSGIQPLPFNTRGELNAPGFKIMHGCDFDFRAHHHRLEDQLREIRAWSAANPGHLPVFVTVNLKGGGPSTPDGTDPIEWERDAMDALDAAVMEHLGREHLLIPDDVRRGHKSVVEAIERLGWPTIDACRGRFLFILDHGGRLRENYLAERPDLAGAIFFTSGPDDAPHAGILVINDPIRDRERIRTMVEAGRIVRTRADAGTKEMRNDDRSRFSAAQESGAQIITTDYPVPDRRHNASYRIVFRNGIYAKPNPLSIN